MPDTMTMTEFVAAARTGKAFSCLFIKRNKKEEGQPRKMLCRTGVKKYVSGVGMKYKPEERNLLTVWDFEKQAYRMINLDWMVWVKVKGRKWFWNEDQKVFIAGGS